VGWGSGEDEESGAILKVIQALGIFYFGQQFTPSGLRYLGLVCDPFMWVSGRFGFSL
jgi:hypothetical protein